MLTFFVIGSVILNLILFVRCSRLSIAVERLSKLWRKEHNALGDLQVQIENIKRILQ